MLRRTRHLITLIMLVACAVLLSDQHAARAHGYIIRAIPQDRAVLARAPSRIQIWFSEILEPRFSTLSLSNQQGESIPLTQDGVVPDNQAQLSARLPASLPDGVYLITIRAAFASDGHVVTETIVFWVGQQTDQKLSSLAPTQDAAPLEVVWRMLTLSGLAILFGTLLLYALVLLPSWSNFRYRVGGLAPRVITRLNVLIWIAIFLAAAGCIVALFQQTMTLFRVDLLTGLRSGQWTTVLTGTQFGDVLMLRIVFILVAAGLHGTAAYIANRQPDYVKTLWIMNIPVAGLLLGTLSISSHAAGSTLWPLAAILVDWLHLLANAAWVGGLVALAITLPIALAPLPTQDRSTALLVALRRFSKIATLLVALIVVTGIFSALLYIRQPADVPDTNYGRTLVAKVILLMPLLLVALYHHLAVTQGRLAGLAQRFRLSERVTRLIGSMRLEASLGIGIVLVAALLTATPPPVPTDSRLGSEPPSQILAIGDIQGKLTLDPGAAGTNSYEFSLSRSGQPLTGAQVEVRFVYPALDKRTEFLTLDDAGDGNYLGAGTGLERSGIWQVQADVRLAGSDQSALPVRMTFVWPLPETAPNTETRQVSLLNWLSAAAVLVVMGVWLLPEAVRRIRTVAPVFIAVGVMASLATLLLGIFGVVLLNGASSQTDALRNPTPVVVNPVMADAASLAAGKSIYEAQCMKCHGANGSGNGAADSPVDIRARLVERRDEDLFHALQHKDGSGGPLSETDRWNVINYLRSSVFMPVNR